MEWTLSSVWRVLGMLVETGKFSSAQKEADVSAWILLCCRNQGVVARDCQY